MKIRFATGLENEVYEISQGEYLNVLLSYSDENFIKELSNALNLYEQNKFFEIPKLKIKHYKSFLKTLCKFHPVFKDLFVDTNEISDILLTLFDEFDKYSTTASTLPICLNPFIIQFLSYIFIHKYKECDYTGYKTEMENIINTKLLFIVNSKGEPIDILKRINEYYKAEYKEKHCLKFFKPIPNMQSDLLLKEKIHFNVAKFKETLDSNFFEYINEVYLVSKKLISLIDGEKYNNDVNVFLTNVRSVFKSIVNEYKPNKIYGLEGLEDYEQIANCILIGNIFKDDKEFYEALKINMIRRNKDTKIIKTYLEAILIDIWVCYNSGYRKSFCSNKDCENFQYSKDKKKYLCSHHCNPTKKVYKTKKEVQLAKLYRNFKVAVKADLIKRNGRNYTVFYSNTLEGFVLKLGEAVRKVSIIHKGISYNQYILFLCDIMKSIQLDTKISYFNDLCNLNYKETSLYAEIEDLKKKKVQKKHKK